MTHFSRKKNAMVDETSAQNSSKMKELQLECEASGVAKTEEDICVEVTGHVTGYVRGRGLSKASLIAQRLADIEAFKKRAEEAEKRSEQAEKRSADLEFQLQSQQQLMQRLENRQAEMQNQQSDMQDLLKALRAELQSRKQGNESTFGNDN